MVWFSWTTRVVAEYSWSNNWIGQLGRWGHSAEISRFTSSFNFSFHKIGEFFFDQPANIDQGTTTDVLKIL